MCVPRSASLARLCDVADALKVAITGRAELTGTSALSTPVAVDPLRGVEFWHEYPAGYTEGQLHDLSEDGIEILEPFERE